MLPAGQAVIVLDPLLTVMVMDADRAGRNYLIVGSGLAPARCVHAGNELSTFIGPPQ